MGSVREPRISWCYLLCLAIVTLTKSAEGRSHIPKPKSCDPSETWFRHGRRFVYTYVANVDTGFSGTSDVITGSRLSCEVTVNVPKPCEMTIKLSGCELKEKGLDGQLSVSPKSKQLARLLQKHEVYVQMDKGVVLERQIVVDKEEPVFITNIKRAVVSQLQLPILPSKHYEHPVTLHDQFGECQAQIRLDRAARSLWVHRDLTQCTLPSVLGRQLHLMSFAKQFQLWFLQKPISDVLYPFESMLECQYKVVNNLISMSTCHHGQAFKPITFDGELTASAAINVTQSLSLNSSGKLSRKDSILNRFLNGRHLVKLMMQLEMAPPQDVTSSRLLQALSDIMVSNSGSQSDDNITPEKFRTFVDLARDARSGALGEVLEAVLECKTPEGSCVLQTTSSDQVEATMLQKEREWFLADGLLSCGTEACVVTYLSGVQRGVVPLLDAEISLLNMALFYQPAPTVIANMLALCQSSKTHSRSSCWLILGTLTGRLAQTLAQDLQQQQQHESSVSQQEARAAVTQVLHHFGGMLGEACIQGKGLVRYPSLIQQHQQQIMQDSALLALKSLANAGAAVSLMDHGDVDSGVMTSLLQCVNNSDLPDSVSTAALTALTKATLNPAVKSSLTTILTDPSRPVALRTMAFDRLLHDHDVSTVRHLADVIDREKFASLKMYMVTRVGHLLESNLPQGYSLRSLWRTVLEKKPLPVLEQMKGRGSEYVELSRYVELPFSKDQLGAKLGVGVVFEPSSVVPSRLRVTVSFLLFNHSVELLDVGLDVQGFENIAREFMATGIGLNPSDSLGATVARLMQAMLLKHWESPLLFLQDKQLAAALRKLLEQVNMPTGDSLQAQLHLKVFGNEVGYLNVQDIIRMVRGEPPVGAPQQPPGVTLAQKLSKGLHYFMGKSSRLLEVVRIFPTVVGLPWRADVQGTMVASGSFNINGTVAKFLSRQGPLDLTGGVRARLGVRVICEGSVVIGDLSSSGIRLNTSVLLNKGVDGRASFEPRPGSHLLKLGLGATKKPFTLISVRSNIYQLHNGNEMLILTPRTQVAVDRCVSHFMQIWTGQKVCLKGFYQHVPFMPHNPLPFVSGPVHLDIMAESIDKSLKEYTVTFLLSQRKESPLILFEANFSAQGENMKRNMEIRVRMNTLTKALEARAQVPEFGLQYALDFNSSFGRQKELNHRLLSSILTVGPHVIHSFIVESQDLHKTPAAGASVVGPPGSGEQSPPQPVTGMLFRINMSMPGLSLEVLTNSSANQQPGFFSQGLNIRYFCEPHLGILYALHWKPELATVNGHTSVWHFSNQARFLYQQDWSASDIMAVLVPGYNVTISNTITANATHAFRATKFYWTYGLGTPNISTDFLTMVAELHNDTVGHHQNFHYTMTLEHQDKYDIRLDGSLTGPLSNMAFQTDIVYTAKHHRRDRRSLRSISNRLKQMEEEVEQAMETVEQMVVRRGAELTEAFLKWLSGEGEQEQAGGNKTQMSPTFSSPIEAADGDGGAQQKGFGTVNSTVEDRFHVGSLLSIFTRPSWKMDIDANLKFKPKMLKGSPEPVGYGVEWDLHVNLPHLQKDLVFFNGTLDQLKMLDVSTDWHLHSDVLNFTLMCFLQQRVDYPKVYHWHHWKLVEFSKHRYNRTFSILVDLEQNDRFMYHLHLVSPHTNLTHQINFTTLSPTLRTLQANLTLHSENPTFNIRFAERCDLTTEGLVTDLSLNSTWLDMVMDMDIDWSSPGAIMATQHLDSMGKVPIFNGPRQLEIQLKMDRTKMKQKPSLTIRHNDTAGQVTSMIGQLLDKDLVLFTFTSQKPKAKKPETLLNWHIRLLEPTLLQHSLSWEAPMTEPLLQGLYRIYRTGARTFMLFGETVADNVYRNVSDMIIPFANSTISQAVDRVVQGQMKKVVMAGLDPRQHMPIMVKVLKGGLQVIQALQLSWQNSLVGHLTYSLGAHRVVSTAAWLSTRLHYMVVQDPPFPLRQYVNFHIMPIVNAARASLQFNFTVPLPFVWNQYLNWPQPRLFTRQIERHMKIFSSHHSTATFPFMAILSRDRVQTFDGLSYNVEVPGKNQCTYLLGTDSAVKNQSLLLTEVSSTVAMRQSTVSMGWNGSVIVREGDDRALNHIPAELVMDHTNVTLTNGLLTVNVDSQMLMTYDPESEVFVIEMARHLHNRSLGLLGTTTHDLGDDLRLPSGQLLADPSSFQEKFELSGHEACRNKSVKQVASSPCDDHHAQFCRKLFEDGVASPLTPCFSTVDPAQFLDLCLSRICSSLPQKPANACPVVSTYVRLCASRGHQVTPDTQAFLDACDGCRRQHEAVDIVLCPALYSADRSPEEARSVIDNLVSHVTRDTRFGLVHSPHQHAHAHLFHGQLFVKEKELQRNLDNSNLTVQGSAGSTFSIREILEAASNYPFRAGARRFAILFTGPTTPEIQNVTWLQQQLWNHSISLILVSSDLDSHRVLSASWDGQVLCRGCDKGSVSLAMVETGRLAAETRGMYISFDALKKGRSSRMRKLLQPFEHLLSQPSPGCASDPRGI